MTDWEAEMIDWENARDWDDNDERRYQDAISEVASELKANWCKWQDLLDGDCEFGSQVAAILADREAGKLERIADLRDKYVDNCAKWLIDGGAWHGIYGDVKYAAGLRESSFVLPG